MKHFKILSLAALALLSLLTFVASSASATALYSGGTKLGAGTEIGGGSVQFVIENPNEGFVWNTCQGAAIEGETENEGGVGIPVEIGIQVLTMSPCTRTVDTLKNGTLEIQWTSGTSGSVIWRLGEVTMVNLFAGSCIYGPGKEPLKIGTLNGSTTGKATIEINAIIPKLGGVPICPETRWTANYTVFPSPLHVTES